MRPRLDERDIVSITVEKAPAGSDLQGHTFFSLSRDISTGGLSFSAHTSPPVGSKLRFTVAFQEPVKTVSDLLGRVTWVSRIPDEGRYVVGVDLSLSPAAALMDWKETVGRKLAK